MAQIRCIVGRVQRFDDDAVGGKPIERVDITARRRLGRGFGPGGQVAGLEFKSVLGHGGTKFLGWANKNAAAAAETHLTLIELAQNIPNVAGPPGRTTRTVFGGPLAVTILRKSGSTI